MSIAFKKPLLDSGKLDRSPVPPPTNNNIAHNAYSPAPI
jgi:hypothetical protein